MSPAIHRTAAEPAIYVVPRPRVTDAIGDALRRAYRGIDAAPGDFTASLSALDRVGNA